MTTDKKFNRIAFINEHMLDDDLNNTLRKKTDKINLDDLEPTIRTKINNIATNTGIAYDDTDLRNRIINLENGKVALGNVFVKDADKIAAKDLNADLADAYVKAKLVPNKADINYVQDNFRPLNIPIYENDLDAGLQTKFNTLASNIQNIKTDFKANSSINEDIATLKIDTQNLKTDKLDINVAADTFRRLDKAITVADCDTSISSPIAQVDAINNQLPNLATTATLKNYRKKDVNIALSDLDSSLQKTITNLNASIAGTEELVKNVYKNSIQADERQWLVDYVGKKESTSNSETPTNKQKEQGFEPYSLLHNTCDYCGTLNTTGNFTYATVISFLYYSMFHSRNNMFFGQGKTISWYGLDTVKQLLDNHATQIDTLNSKINELENQIKTLNTKIENLENKSPTDSSTTNKGNV